MTRISKNLLSSQSVRPSIHKTDQIQAKKKFQGVPYFLSTPLHKKFWDTMYQNSLNFSYLVNRHIFLMKILRFMLILHRYSIVAGKRPDFAHLPRCVRAGRSIATQQNMEIIQAEFIIIKTGI